LIGGERDHQRIAVPLCRKRRARRDRRTGIPPDRLEQNIGLDADGRELFGDKKTILRVGDDNRPAEQSRVGHPANGVLKRRFRTEQRQELLGPAFARGRPQPCAGAAAHDQGNDGFSHNLPTSISVRADFCLRR
jgi:hypothetical protein